MKKYFAILCCALLAVTACQPNTDDNKGLEWESLDVNFMAALNGQFWPEGAELGVIATCTRNGQEATLMSENPVARYVVAEAGEKSLINAATEADKIVSLKGDHNFKFHVVYPYPEGDVDLSAIPVGVPLTQNYGDGIMKSLTFLGSASVITVVPTVQLEVSTLFSILELNIPNDLREGEESNVKSLKVTAPEGFTGFLAQGGTFNVYDGVFTPSESSSANEITMDFGDGLELKDPYTKVYMAVAPFTVPEGGLNMTFTDVDGTAPSISALSSEKEVGSTVAAGETMTAYLSGNSDGIIPVTFPVVFPLGFPEGSSTGYNHANNTWVSEGWANIAACVTATRKQQMWTGNHGTWICKDQPQAYMTWNWTEEINKTGVLHFLETTNNATYKISSIGIKGIWTGDFFEIVIPVRKFAAGSTLRLSMPFCSRSGGPTFWEVLYKDGEEWKSTAQNDLEAFGSGIKRRATWTSPHLELTDKIDTERSVNLNFTNEIKSGEIRIRVQCADGSVVSLKSGITEGLTGPQSKAITAVQIGDQTINKEATGSFYFWNPGKRDNHDIRIELL